MMCWDMFTIINLAHVAAKNGHDSPGMPSGDILVHNPLENSWNGQTWALTSFYSVWTMMYCDMLILIIVAHIATTNGHSSHGMHSGDLMVHSPLRKLMKGANPSLGIFLQGMKCNLWYPRENEVLSYVSSSHFDSYYKIEKLNLWSWGAFLWYIWSTTLCKTPEMVNDVPGHLYIMYEK